jgi:hypothetical protein
MNKNDLANVQQSYSNQYADEISLVDIAVGLYKFRLNWVIAFVLFLVLSLAASVYLHTHKASTVTVPVTVPYSTNAGGALAPVIPIQTILLDWNTQILPELKDWVASNNLPISNITITNSVDNGKGTTVSSPVKLIVTAKVRSGDKKSQHMLAEKLAVLQNSFYPGQVKSALRALKYSLGVAKSQLNVTATQIMHIKKLVSASATEQFMALSQRQYDLQKTIDNLSFQINSVADKFTTSAPVVDKLATGYAMYIIVSLFLSLFLATAYVATLAFFRQVKAAIKGL